MNYASLNQNLDAKRNDSFYVTFLGLENNPSNLLGRQVKEVEMPILNFTQYEPRNKHVVSKYNTVANMEEISIQFDDDVGGLTTRLLYEIVYAQAAHTQDLFDIRIDTLDHNGDVIDHIELKQCFIQTVTQSQLNYQAPEKSIITVSFRYYNIDYGDPDCAIVSKENYFAGFYSNPNIQPASMLLSGEQFGAVTVVPPPEEVLIPIDSCFSATLGDGIDQVNDTLKFRVLSGDVTDIFVPPIEVRVYSEGPVLELTTTLVSAVFDGVDTQLVTTDPYLSFPLVEQICVTEFLPPEEP